jgi:hypothetical protein
MLSLTKIAISAAVALFAATGVAAQTTTNQTDNPTQVCSRTIRITNYAREVTWDVNDSSSVTIDTAYDYNRQ